MLHLSDVVTNSKSIIFNPSEDYQVIFVEIHHSYFNIQITSEGLIKNLS